MPAWRAHRPQVTAPATVLKEAFLRHSLLCCCIGWAVLSGGPVQAAPPAAPDSAANDIGYPSPDAALAALRLKPGVRMREENDWYVANDPAENSFWSIAQPTHPAHPTAVKRSLVQDASGVRLVMKVRCGAPKAACDAVVHQFEQINEALRQSMRRQAGGAPGR